MRTRILLIALILLVPSGVWAETYLDCDFLSAPSGTANGDTFGCTTSYLPIWISNDASVTYTETGGWGGDGGAVLNMFTTGTEGYCALDMQHLNSISTTQTNLRYLVKYSSGYVAGASAEENKTNILRRDPFADNTRSWISGASPDPEIGGRQYAIAHAGVSGAFYHGNGVNCEGTVCDGTYECSQCSANGSAYSDSPFIISNYEDEWIAVEWQVVSTTGEITVFVWTQDEAFAGTYMDYTAAATTGIDYYEYLGSYTGEASSAIYRILDDIVMSDTYIGPPDGFIAEGTYNLGTFSGSGSFQ